MSVEQPTAEIEPEHFGPVQRQIVQALLEADGPLTIREIEDAVDERTTRNSVNSALTRLRDRDVLEAEQYDPLGWVRYRLSTHGMEG